MSANKILNKKIVGMVVKDGKRITVSAATETSNWRRPDFAAEKVGALLCSNIPVWTQPIPEDTTEICSRETEHISNSDQRSHITLVCFNATQQGTTMHLPVTKPTEKEGEEKKDGK